MMKLVIDFFILIFKIGLYLGIFCITIIYYIIKIIIQLIKNFINKKKGNHYEYKNSKSKKVGNSYEYEYSNYDCVRNPTFKPKVDSKGDGYYEYRDLYREYQYVKYDDNNSAKMTNSIPHKEEEIKNIEEPFLKEYKVVNIKLYLNRNNKKLVCNDEIKTKLLNLSDDECYLSVIDESDKYLILTDETDTFIYYPEVIKKILNHCKDDSYFIIGHDNKEEYKYIFKDNQILLEGYNEQETKNEYTKIKDSILKTTKLITRYTLKMKSNYNKVPYNNHTLEWDDLKEVIKKLKSKKAIDITELPYLSEVDSFLKYSLPKIKEDYDKYIPKEITSKKENTNYNLDIYISNYYSELVEENELNCKIIGLEDSNLGNIYTEYSDNYIEISLSEDTTEDYSDLLKSLFEYCGSDIYAIYNHKDTTYKFTINNSKCCINNYSDKEIKNKYNSLKNEVINMIDILGEKLIFIEKGYDYEFLDETGSFYDYEILADKLRDSEEVSIFELPFMEEAASNLKKLEPKVNRIYVPEKNQGLHDFYYEEPNYIEEEPKKVKPINKKEKTKKKELSESEKRFEKEADYFGLTKREREICKLENMTPEEFVEAEEAIDPLRDDEL